MAIINNLKIPLIFLLVFIVYFLISIPFYSGDVKNHVSWVNSLITFGPLNFYNREIPGFYTPNYPPLTILLFFLSEQLYQAVILFTNWINSMLGIFPSQLVYLVHWENVRYAFYKIFPILGNLLICFGIYKLISLNNLSSAKKKLVCAIFLFNPTVIYVSAIWGQVDFIPLAFVIFSLFFLLSKKLYLPVFFLGLALMSKQTSIIFLPLFGYLIFNKYGLKDLIKSTLLIVVMFYVFFIPFHQSSLTWPFEFYLSSFNSVAKTVGENVYNFWGAVFNFNNPLDETKYLLLSFRQWGILLFSLFMIYPSYIFIRQDKSIKNILSFMAILSLTYFFFITRLHERHLAPAILFLSILPAFDKKYILPLIFITTFYMLNLYNGSHQPNIEFLNLAVENTLLIKALIVVYFVMNIYLVFLFKEEKK